MACFLGCFGFSKKRKRPKYGNRVLFGDQGHGSYEPLQPDDTITFNISEKNPISSDSKSRDEPKDRLGSKIKKKVSFNLNVRTYEPIQNDEATDNFSDEEPEKAIIPTLQPEKNSTGSRIGPYPSNHRYQSFTDSYDEYDDIKLEESDIDDEFVDTDNEEEDSHESDFDDDDYDGPNTSPNEYLDPFYSSKMESGKRDNCSRSDGGKTDNFMCIRALRNEEVQKVESIRSVRDRSQYVHSVLNPVENLTQWKAVKARATPTVKQKENIETEQEWVPLRSSQSFSPLPLSDKLNSNHSKPLMQGFAVDSSLSNWLNSSKAETISVVSLKKNE